MICILLFFIMMGNFKHFYMQCCLISYFNIYSWLRCYLKKLELTGLSSYLSYNKLHTGIVIIRARRHIFMEHNCISASPVPFLIFLLLLYPYYAPLHFPFSEWQDMLLQRETVIDRLLQEYVANVCPRILFPWRARKHEVLFCGGVYEAIGRVNTGVQVEVLQAAHVEFKRKLEGHLVGHFGEYKQLGVAEEAVCCLWVTVRLKS